MTSADSNKAFNSLSRDHSHSLLHMNAVVKFFQLPLSGSREGKDTAPPLDHKKPFNSLSRDHFGKGKLEIGCCQNWLSFNSLSRDHLNRRCWSSSIRYSALSTPSLGITISGLRHISVGGSCFQLPLSGSPSPIPGFSGSPRLSAAAPLRTSVFSGHYLKI